MAYEYKEYEYVENCLMKAGEVLKEVQVVLAINYGNMRNYYRGRRKGYLRRVQFSSVFDCAYSLCSGNRHSYRAWVVRRHFFHCFCGYSFLFEIT